MRNLGGDDIDVSAGILIPVYVFLLNGWRVKPQESNHTLYVTNGILLVDGGGDPFVSTSGSFIVRINYQQPVQAISFATGGGGGATPAQIAAEVISQLNATSIPVNVIKVIGQVVVGTGLENDPWGPQ